jgi:hypothetical protein
VHDSSFFDFNSLIAAHASGGPHFWLERLIAEIIPDTPEPIARKLPHKGSTKSLNEFIYRPDFALGDVAIW